MKEENIEMFSVKEETFEKLTMNLRFRFKRNTYTIFLISKGFFYPLKLETVGSSAYSSVVELWPGMPKTLGSVPSTGRRKTVRMIRNKCVG